MAESVRGHAVRNLKESGGRRGGRRQARVNRRVRSSKGRERHPDSAGHRLTLPERPLKEVGRGDGHRGEPGSDDGRRPPAQRLVEPHHHVPAPVVRQLHRRDDHRVVVDRDQRCDRPGAGHRAFGQVDPVALPDRVADRRARHQRVPEAVHALVGLRVGEARGAQQRDPQGRRRTRVAGTYRARDVVAVRRVGDQRHAPARLLQVHEAVVARLELGGLPAGVGVGGPVEVAELGLGRVPLGVHVQREGQLQELLRLVPVDLGVDVQAARSRGRGKGAG